MALPYISIHDNRDIFNDEIVLIFFMDTIAKLHVKRLTAALHSCTETMLRLTNDVALVALRSEGGAA